MESRVREAGHDERDTVTVSGKREAGSGEPEQIGG